MANLTKCLICGEKYNYCPTCSGTHAWKFYTDTHEHYQIWITIEQLNAGVLTTKRAKDDLEYLGITADTDLSIFKPSIANQIEKIVNYTEPKPVKANKKTDDKSE